MASLRGATVLWKGQEVQNGSVSPPAYVPATNVAIFISNDENEAHTFKVQVTDTGSDRGGLNEYNHSLLDGGLVWYDYYEKDLSAVVSINVGGNGKVCLDLSPFAPQLVRLVCTAGNPGDVTAIVTSYGPN